MTKSPKNALKEPRTFEEIRRSRNRVLALSLAGFVILVFFISIAKMG
ncbi:hypothetical protein [Novosphingobium guangzhouense]|nr:hypothetical protein [Novosphingobium guangzhouense]